MFVTGTFIALGLSGGIPALHLVLAEGWYKAIHFASLGWLGLMALLYISGALIYAVRIPERIWPGKFDIWVSFNSVSAGTVLIRQNLTSVDVRF